MGLRRSAAQEKFIFQEGISNTKREGRRKGELQNQNEIALKILLILILATPEVPGVRERGKSGNSCSSEGSVRSSRLCQVTGGSHLHEKVDVACGYFNRLLGNAQPGHRLFRLCAFPIRGEHERRDKRSRIGEIFDFHGWGYP